MNHKDEKPDNLGGLGGLKIRNKNEERIIEIIFLSNFCFNIERSDLLK